MKKSLLFIFSLLFIQSSLVATRIDSSIDEHPITFVQSTCGTLQTSGRYVLDRDLSSDGTCFTLKDSVITLDCQDHTIVYDAAEAGPGIVVSASEASLVNCRLRQAMPFHHSPAIHYSSSTGTLSQMSITTQGENSHAVLLSSSQDILIEQSSLTSSGEDASALAILESTRITARDTILTSTAQHTNTLLLFSSSENTFLHNTLRSTSSSLTSSASLTSSTHNTFLNNSILYGLTGIRIEDFPHFTSTNNFEANIFTPLQEEAVTFILIGPVNINILNPTQEYLYDFATPDSTATIFFPVTLSLGSLIFHDTAHATFYDLGNTEISSYDLLPNLDLPVNLPAQTLSQEGISLFKSYRVRLSLDGKIIERTFVLDKPFHLDFSMPSDSPEMRSDGENPPSFLGIVASENLSAGILFNVTTLPSILFPAEGNNKQGNTTYWVDTSSNIRINVSIRAEGPLTYGGDTIPLSSEFYSFNLTLPNLTNSVIAPLSISESTLASRIRGRNRIYLKFYLDVAAAQPPGSYINRIIIRARPS